MKIALTTVGSRGDIQPYIDLAKELNNNGHEAIIATHSWAHSLIKSFDVPHFIVKPDINCNKIMHSLINSSNNPIKNFSRGCHIMVKSLYVCHESFLSIAKEVDLIIGHGIMGSAEADIVDKPFLMVALEPYIVPRQPWKSKNPLKNIVNEISGVFAYRLLGKSIEQFRETIKAPVMRGRGSGQNQIGTVLAQSKYLTKPDEFWEPNTTITGYIFSEASDSDLPDSPISNFVKKKNVVLFTLGSMYHESDEAHRIAEIIIKASHLAQVNALIIMKNIDLKLIPKSENSMFITETPYSWLLPHVSLVVHHFGFGTTAEVLKAGLPSIPLPHIFDQHWRSKNLHKRGLTHAPLSYRNLIAQSLAQAIMKTMVNKSMKIKVGKIGKKIREEHGKENAINYINSITDL